MPHIARESRGPGRHTVRRSGAYKLLTLLLYGRMFYLQHEYWGITRITHMGKLARHLGTESRRVRGWLDYLERAGYIESLTISSNYRQAQFRIRRPPNIQ